MKFVQSATALLLLVVAAGGAFARPIDPAERRYSPYTGQLPQCGDPAVLEKIQSRFSDAETEYWKSGLRILGFDAADEIGFRSNGLDYVPRRYCVVHAMMNDQRVRTVSYSVGEHLGFIGESFGVEYCVGGLDRDNAFAPDCKMARP